MAQNILSITGLTKAFGSRVLFEDIALGLDAGSRLGLIGDNGAGKSTLLKILAGALEADAGQVNLRGGVRAAYLPQVPELPAGSIRAALAAPFAELRAAIAAYGEAAAHAGADDDPAARIEELGGWDWEHRLEGAAQLLGLPDLTRDTRSLSGGEAKRVALAALAAQPPDLILLDEPTNHLDTSTIEWLETWLTRLPAAAVVVTHDRYFLERVVDRMAELRGGALRCYAGSYADYLAARSVEEALSERTDQRRARILAAELDWARRSPQARTTKSRARLDRVDAGLAEQQESRARARAPRVAGLPLGRGPRLGRIILELVGVQAGFAPAAGGAARPLFAPFDLTLSAGERWGIVGDNGAGKTSLLRLVTGALAPLAGTVRPGTNTVMATFDQHRSVLDPARSLRETVAPEGGDTVHPGGRPEHVASWLARFAFPGSALQMRVGQLSGGERNRLALARFLLTPANVLLLDEPTNDLDLLTMSVLEDALVNFAGCALVVSHDRYFLDKVATGIVGFEAAPTGGAQLVTVQGNYDAYARHRAARRAAAGAAAAAAPAPTKPPQPAPPPQPAARRRSYAERQALGTIEARIESAEAHVAALEAGLTDPAVWSAGGARGRALQADVAAARAVVEGLYGEWEALGGP